MRKILILLSFVWAMPGFAYQLMVIQTISETGKTFVTRGGKSEGLTDGVRGTFSIDNAAITAEAVEVSRGLVVWRVIEEDAFVPFKKNEIVTFNFSTEAIWFKVPTRAEKISGLTLRDKLGEEKRQLVTSLQIKAFRGIGLTEQVSSVDTNNDGSRAIVQLETIYGFELRKGLNFDVGFRYDQEANELGTFTISSKRLFATLGMSYFMYEFTIGETFTPYIGASFGYGITDTNVGGSDLSGNAFILPHVRVGLETFISSNWAAQIETGFESINNKESFNDGTSQDSVQSNIKLGFGLRTVF